MRNGLWLHVCDVTFTETDWQLLGSLPQRGKLLRVPGRVSTFLTTPKFVSIFSKRLPDSVVELPDWFVALEELP